MAGGGIPDSTGSCLSCYGGIFSGFFFDLKIKNLPKKIIKKKREKNPQIGIPSK